MSTPPSIDLRDRFRKLVEISESEREAARRLLIPGIVNLTLAPTLMSQRGL